MRLPCSKQKAIIFGWVMGMSLLLSGCAGWTGLLPERYDGRAIEKNEEAIEAYSENQEIVGEGKELYVLETFSEEVLEPSLPLSEEPARQMEPGVYTVGEDIPEGRHPFLYMTQMAEPGQMNNATLHITDAEGKLILQELLTPGMMVPLEADLQEGNIVTLAGEDFPVVMGLTETDPALEGIFSIPEADVLLTPGIWEVGEHVEAGTYVIHPQPMEGYLYLFEETTEPRVIEFRGTIEADEETGQAVQAGSELEVTFEEGQKIYLKDTASPVPMMQKNGGN